MNLPRAHLCLEALVHKSPKNALWTVVMLKLGFQVPLLVLQLCQAGVVLEVLVLQHLHFTATLNFPCTR